MPLRDTQAGRRAIIVPGRNKRLYIPQLLFYAPSPACIVAMSFTAPGADEI